MATYDRKTGRKTSSVTKPTKYKPETVYVSRQVGKYRVGKRVPIGMAIFLLGGPWVRLIYVGLIGYGLYLLAVGK
jgi:hypothetical protein